MFDNFHVKVIKAYKDLMVKTGLLLGGEQEKAQREMNDVFEFERKLALIYEPKERLRQADKIHHKMTVEELQDLCPAVSTICFFIDSSYCWFD